MRSLLITRLNHSLKCVESFWRLFSVFINRRSEKLEINLSKMNLQQIASGSCVTSNNWMESKLLSSNLERRLVQDMNRRSMLRVIGHVLMADTCLLTYVQAQLWKGTWPHVESGSAVRSACEYDGIREWPQAKWWGWVIWMKADRLQKAKQWLLL